MGHEERASAASLHGLARVQREKHWTAIMDTVLAFMIVFWVAGLTFVDVIPARAEAFMPVIIGVLVIHRLLVVLEHQRRDHHPASARRSDVAVDVAAHLAPRASERTHAA